MEDEMVTAFVQCDRCQKKADLEKFNGNANLRLPAGWGTVRAHVTIHGEHGGRPKKTEIEGIKERVKTIMPDVHICGECLKPVKVKLKAPEPLESWNPKRRVLLMEPEIGQTPKEIADSCRLLAQTIDEQVNNPAAHPEAQRVGYMARDKVKRIATVIESLG